jgi:hypothetical protein
MQNIFSDVAEKIAASSRAGQSFDINKYIELDGVKKMSESIDGFVNKTSNSLDKANTQLQAVRVF